MNRSTARRRAGTRCAAVVAALLALATGPAFALEAGDFPYSGVEVIHTSHSYAELIGRFNAAVKGSKMGLVTRASATLGAKAIGKTIPGNMVIGVYRPDFAVRMLAASVAAGIEAPLRFYIVEESDGTATLAYRLPSAVFAPYGSDQLDAMAVELDVIFTHIAREATAP